VSESSPSVVPILAVFSKLYHESFNIPDSQSESDTDKESCSGALPMELDARSNVLYFLPS